jgi:hypothetical protein
MPKMNDRRERRHQPVWDTLIRGNTAGGFTPNANLALGSYRMFTTAQGANLAITNMESGGSFPAGQTYLILAIRCFLYFRGTTTAAAPLGFDFTMYHHAVSQLYFQLNIGNKEYFAAPAWYIPAGGGLAGDLGTSTDVYFTNGVPSHGSILRLARSISLTPFQNFHVLCTILPLGTGSLITDVAALTAGEISIQLVLDGLQLRDVL